MKAILKAVWDLFAYSVEYVYKGAFFALGFYLMLCFMHDHFEFTTKEKLSAPKLTEHGTK